MANDIYKSPDDPTPFKPLFSSSSDPDPDKTLNAPRNGLTSLSAEGGRTNRENQSWRAARTADTATFREQTGRDPGKSKKLKAAKRKRASNAVEAVAE